MVISSIVLKHVEAKYIQSIHLIRVIKRKVAISRKKVPRNKKERVFRRDYRKENVSGDNAVDVHPVITSLSLAYRARGDNPISYTVLYKTRYNRPALTFCDATYIF